MNNYICEYVCEEHLRKICVRAYSKIQAKTIVRQLIRKHGYKVYLKDINPLYIDNSQKAVNE